MLGLASEREMSGGSDAETYLRDWLPAADGGGLVRVKDLGDGRYAGIKPLLFHWTLIVGAIGDTWGYDDRWCYATEDLAQQALEAWGGRGEPAGWHRHPNSGRRRPDGDRASEYVDF